MLKNLIGRGALFTKLDINLLVCPEKVFNRVSDPAELGLDKEKFPFKIWRDQVHVHETAGTGKKSKIYKPSVGEIIYVTEEKAVTRGRITWSTQKSNKGDQGNYAYFLNFVTDNQLLVQLSGQSRPVIVSPERVRACRGAAVLVAGPVKAKERINEKLRTDYKDEPYPAAASLLDILRASIVVDDPYALAVCAAYVQKEFAAVRMKNRFASDPVESVSVDRLLSEFHTAETVGGTATSAETEDPESPSSYTQQYRDINLNIPVEFPGREPFLCEVQLTLSTISILKKSEQKIYSLLRMENPTEILEQYVFSRKIEEDESTVLSSATAVSTGGDAATQQGQVTTDTIE